MVSCAFTPSTLKVKTGRYLHGETSSLRKEEKRKKKAQLRFCLDSLKRLIAHFVNNIKVGQVKVAS